MKRLFPPRQPYEIMVVDDASRTVCIGTRPEISSSSLLRPLKQREVLKKVPRLIKA